MKDVSIVASIWKERITLDLTSPKLNQPNQVILSWFLCTPGTPTGMLMTTNNFDHELTVSL